ACQGSVRILQKQTSFNRFTCYDGIERSSVAALLYLFPVVTEMFFQICEQKPSQLSGGLFDQLQVLSSKVEKPTYVMLVDSLIDMTSQLCDVLSNFYLSSSATTHLPSSLIQEVRSFFLGANATSVASRRLLSLTPPDEKLRQIQYEMWGSKMWVRYFPSRSSALLVPTEKLDLISSFPAAVINSISGLDPSSHPDCLIHCSNSPSEAILACLIVPCVPSSSTRDSRMAGANYLATDFYIVTSRPAHVRTLGIYLKSELLSAASMDVYLGTTLDTTRIILERVKLPVAASGTHLYYELDDSDSAIDAADHAAAAAPDLAGAASPSAYAYDYQCLRRHRSYPPLTRVCRVSFRSELPFLALGAIELYGFSSLPSVSPFISKLKFRSSYLSRRIESVLQSSSLDNPLSRSGTHLPSLSTPSHAIRSKGSLSSDPASSDPVSPAPSSAPHSPFTTSETLRPTASSLLCKDFLAVANSVPDSRSHREYLAKIVEGLNLAEQVSFDVCLQLEYLRCSLAISERERDLLLSSIGVLPSSLDPNRFLHSEQLQSPLERRLMVKKSSSCQACSTSIGFFSQSQQCHYCFLHVCQACFHPAKEIILEFLKTIPEPSPVCTSCNDRLRHQAQLLSLLRYQSLQNRSQYEELSYESWKILYYAQQMFSPLTTDPQAQPSAHQYLQVVSTYPTAGILQAVPTARDSAPIESVLFDGSLDS
ncbi:MAG: FYVE zinc finger domain-containing protein, partial [archaeon]|nr:FYVE zinc finger domain-containing protein [archaeon]